MIQKVSRRREAAQLEAPVTRERKRVITLAVTPNLPGMEIGGEDRTPLPKSDDVWRKAEKLLTFVAGQGGYLTAPQQPCGKAYGSKIIIDLICRLPGTKEEIGISCKWQREGGSFDEKIPAEAEKLAVLVPRKFVRCYVVLVGPGFKKEKRLHWTGGALDKTYVRVIDFDFFAALAYCQGL